MASSTNSSDHDAETEEDEIAASRFVVGADQMRDGEFYTLDNVREELGADDE